MDGISSFEHLSSSDTGTDVSQKQHRIIISDRHNQQAPWSTCNQPIERRSLLNSFWPQNSPDKPSFKPTTKYLSNSSSFSSLAILNFGPFPSNEWLTSKYTILNFIPKNLFEQFRRLANFYFLITAILQSLLPFTPVGPFTSLAPLVFVVGVTSIKQAYEDYLRHRSDREQNNRSCYVLRGKKITKVRSKDIRVGDFVYVRNNEEIPCDMILLSASGLNGDRCYITTSNLDGEANLKSRTCTTLKDRIGGIDKLNDTLIVIECEHPNATLYEFNGSLRVPKAYETYHKLVRKINQKENVDRYFRLKELRSLHYSESYMIMLRLQRITNRTNNNNNNNNNEYDISSDSIHEIPLDITNLLPRASRLRNTSFIYGLAVYTGHDTKLAKNSHVKPNKFSSTEQRVNLFLAISFLILLIITTISSFRYSTPISWFLKSIEKEDTIGQIFIAHFLLYNYLLPISLYVTLEFVKFFGTLSVINDKNLQFKVCQPFGRVTSDDSSRDMNLNSKCHDKTKSHDKESKMIESPKCNSSDLNEELGQIEVLFSDKTGTLTENCMLFTACSIRGHLYRHLEQKLYFQPNEKGSKNCSKNVAREMAGLKRGRPALLNTFNKAPDVIVGSDQRKMRHNHALEEHFDHRKPPPSDKMKRIDKVDHNDNLVEFFICLCLCSTISLNESKSLAECLKPSCLYNFQSASPDEEALITAAHQYGITMCKSNDHESYIMIKRSGKKSAHVAGSHKGFKPIIETKNSNDEFIVRHFERLMLFEFNSSRKRMSLVYRDCDNDCLIMVSKGSEELLDCVNFSQLDNSKERTINETLGHFEAFSRSGLRTLLVAKRVVSEQEYKSLDDEMKQVRMSIHNRDYLLDRLYRQAEKGLELIGATAVEDSLQEGVPETIASLKEAGVKVWLLTGDKVETAQSVAYLCKLLDPDMSQFLLVRQRDLQACRKLLITYNEQLDSIKYNRSCSKSVSSKSRANIKDQKRRFALIADGRSLHYAMKYVQFELARLCQSCDVVLGCRLSPLQKAEVVAMIKNGDTKPITAAIGDGANDVSMIQEAHVGIGISGKEGRQAVNSADFAIGRFHMVRRLLFVHGHLFYYRAAQLILYFFYKNFLFIMPQFLYSFFNLSSAQSLYQPIQLISYNLFVTSLPILFYGLHEIHIPEYILEDYPKLYKINRGNVLLRVNIYLTWFVVALLQAALIFGLIQFIWGSHSPFLESGKMGNANSFSLLVFFVVVIEANIKLYFLARYHSFWFVFSLLLSIAMVPTGLYLYSLLDLSTFLDDNSYYGQMKAYLTSPMFWVAVFINVTAAMIPDVIWYARNQVIFHQRIKLLSIDN